MARCLGKYRTIGASLSRDDLRFSPCDENYVYSRDELERLLDIAKPDLIHGQPDEAVADISNNRAMIRERGCAVYLPRVSVIATCQDKWLTYNALQRCRVPVPHSALPNSLHEIPSDKIHARPRMGAGGKGSISNSKRVVGAFLENGDRHKYMVAELLPGPTVTYQALFDTGRLVASQLRRRLAWTNGDRGSCRIGETFSDPATQRIAEKAVAAVDILPHGIYGVDMMLDASGSPRVTEINIGRFFTTVEFFATAGLNFPELFARIAFGEKVEHPGANPLHDGLQWHRSMDAQPRLVLP